MNLCSDSPRLISEHELPSVCSLMEAVYGWNYGVAHLAWKYFYRGHGSRLYGLYDGSVLVTLQGVQEVFIGRGEARVAVWLLEDGMTHPHYQGRGFFTRMIRFVQSQEKPLLTFANRRSFPTFRKLGWMEIDHATILAKPPIGGIIGPLPQTLKCSEALHVIRDGDYLGWRFLRMPDRRYEVLVLDDGSYAIVAVLVRHKLRIGCIAAMEVVSPSSGVKLLGEVCRALKQHRVHAIVVVTTSKHSLNGLLKRAGFLPIPPKLMRKEVHVMAWQLPSELLATQEADCNIDFMWGDWDIV